MNYFKRMFSWKGEAGRLEFLGWQLLPCGLIGLFGIFPIVLNTWFAWNISYLPKLCGVFLLLLCLPLSICSVARRLRNVGWPVWLAFLFLIPVLNSLGILLILVLVLMPAATGKEAQQPTYFFPNCCVGIGGFLLPLILIFGMVILAKQNPQMFIKILPQKHVEEINAEMEKEKQTNQILPNEDKLSPTPQIAVPDTAAADSSALPTSPSQIRYTKNPYLMTSPARAERPNMVQGERSFLFPEIPAPNTSVLAEHLKWDLTPQACDTQCGALYSLNSMACKQLTAVSKKARLCMIHILNKTGNRQVHQVVIDKYGMPLEDTLFEYNRPVALARYQKGELMELFTKWSLDDIKFFRIIKPIPTDWTDVNGKPSPYYTDITIQIYPDQNKWVSFYQYDEQIDGAAGSVVQTPNEHTFTTPFNGFDPSTQFVEMFYGDKQ